MEQLLSKFNYSKGDFKQHNTHPNVSFKMFVHIYIFFSIFHSLDKSVLWGYVSEHDVLQWQQQKPSNRSNLALAQKRAIRSIRLAPTGLSIWMEILYPFSLPDASVGSPDLWNWEPLPWLCTK